MSGGSWIASVLGFLTRGGRVVDAGLSRLSGRIVMCAGCRMELREDDLTERPGDVCAEWERLALAFTRTHSGCCPWFGDEQEGGKSDE